MDPRVRRTVAALHTAALELAAERDVTTVTIADIAERASINRATVYQHYKGRDELLLDALETRVVELARAAAECPLTQPGDTVPPELANLLRHVSENDGLYRRMLGPTGSALFVCRLREVLADEVAAQLADVPHRELRAHYLAGAIVGLISRWLVEEQRPSVDVTADVVWQLLRR
ncbi:TetR family transcriptional regulator [Lentzea sp. NBRC 105346]|uniref:TetR/AcrR family transcriptional regulator n=1 Tax=Lentzea sp. NBRC 105346 TaxID=3032205 RepID=UPI0024A349CD|nr:TetR/AcrR family transcriptional regulator [Lentzea sp. NBRC 105346]GLZ32263.1 TetR family transcriptional regulator [Lentzea sp. NBRC 105346]